MLSAIPRASPRVAASSSALMVEGSTRRPILCQGRHRRFCNLLFCLDGVVCRGRLRGGDRVRDLSRMPERATGRALFCPPPSVSSVEAVPFPAPPNTHPRVAYIHCPDSMFHSFGKQCSEEATAMGKAPPKIRAGLRNAHRAVLPRVQVVQ